MVNTTNIFTFRTISDRIGIVRDRADPSKQVSRIVKLAETPPNWATFSASFVRPYKTEDGTIEKSSEFYWAFADDTGFIEKKRDDPRAPFRMHGH